MTWLLIPITLLAGCATDSPPPSALMARAAAEGKRQAIVDAANGRLVEWVYRAVAPGGHDSRTGLPYADAGADAADPEWAVYVQAYNAEMEHIRPDECGVTPMRPLTRPSYRFAPGVVPVGR